MFIKNKQMMIRNYGAHEWDFGEVVCIIITKKYILNQKITDRGYSAEVSSICK